MPGLPYPAFRMMNTEPGGGKPSPYARFPYDDKPTVNSQDELTMAASA
jgi:hypothetical protein